jgi:hypothetical protein
MLLLPLKLPFYHLGLILDAELFIRTRVKGQISNPSRICGLNTDLEQSNVRELDAETVTCDSHLAMNTLTSFSNARVVVLGGTGAQGLSVVKGTR